MDDETVRYFLDAVRNASDALMRELIFWKFSGNSLNHRLAFPTAEKKVGQPARPRLYERDN